VASVDPALREVIREILDTELRNNYYLAPIPGVITRVDDEGSRCDVLPGIQRARPALGNEEIEHEPLPLLTGVQLLVPQTDSVRVRMFVPLGTRCLAFVSAWDMGRWLRAAPRDMPVETDDPTLTPPESAFAIPLSLASNVRDAGGRLEIVADDVRIGNNPSNAGNLLFTDGTNSAMNAIFNGVTGWLKAYIDAAALAGAPPTLPWSYSSNPFTGTTSLKGS
jgi:hypothetical protein